MDTDVLAQLIDTKLELLLQLRQLATRNVELLECDEMPRIIRYLAAKQGLLNAVEELERRLDPFRDQDPDQRQWRSPAHRQRAREASEKCDSLLREIMELERQGEARLVLRRDEATEQLRGFHYLQQVTHAYLTPPDASGHQFDASCET